MWKCLRCEEPMHATLAKEAEAALDRANINQAPNLVMVHMCGRCNQMHFEVGGALRKPTPAEELQIRVQYGLILDKIEATTYESPTDEVTMYVPIQ